MSQYNKITPDFGSNSGFISKAFIEKLLDETRLEDIIKDFISLKKEGANYKGLSPFVDEKTPSFVVSPAKHIWKCFSSGKGGNSVVSFLMETGLSYPESIEVIAKKLGRSIEYENTKESKAYKEKLDIINGLRPTLKGVIAAYQKELINLPEKHLAKLEVFEKRQYNQEILDTYQIGYAPGNKFTYNKLKEKGLVKDGEEISLLNRGSDFFYNRVVYTICDANGEPVGLAGRELKEVPKVKWLNPRSNTLYNKDSIWYGLHIAKYKARTTKIIYIVEGYNDVIAFQTHGITNTVASCGTSISDGQIKILKKYVDTVYLAMDGDKAGQKTVLKTIPRFIEAGFRCYVIDFNDCDPDDFVRLHAEKIEKGGGLEETLKAETQNTEGFKFLLNELKDKDDVQKSVLTKTFCSLISKINDDSVVEIYQTWLVKESSVKLPAIKKWVGEYQKPQYQSDNKGKIQDNEYDLPKNVQMTDTILNDIKRYQMFQINNQIYSQLNASQPPYKFRSCSNFSVDIIQHMSDDAFPKKLVSAQNIFNNNVVFDTPSDTFNTIGVFKNAMTKHGNFRWNGNNTDLERLQALLFDKMGSGRSLIELGWMDEGFFVFNNLVVVPNGEDLEIDKNGCFKFNNSSYYVPSANNIYKKHKNRYGPQKGFINIKGAISEFEYFKKIHRVHGNHAISAILHAIACLFHDIVAKQLRGFPINFNQGLPGTGKDTLNHAVRSLWGIPLPATNLEGGNSSATAAIREMAQFQNGLMEWSEYKRGDTKLDGTIKALWDLRGKKIGTLDSRIATDNIPILSGVALTGNDIIDNEAIITRVIWNEMNQNQFTEDDEREFQELDDFINQGVTHITIKILKQRELVEKQFNKQYRMLMDVYQRRIPDCNKRMLKNISTLTAFYEVLKDKISFPFASKNIIDHFVKISEAQMSKITSSSIITRWWDCFIASMRGTLMDQILVGQDFKLEGNLLYFQYTNCYNKLQRQWFMQYRDSAPAKATMKEAIEKDLCYHGYKNVVDFSSGTPRRQSSAIIIELTKLPADLPDLIKAEISRQEFERKLNPSTPPAQINNNENDDEVQTDLPF